MVKVYKISHFLGKLAPLGRKFHHILATLFVVIGNRDIFSRLFVVDVSLSYAQFFFHSKLHRQAMGVPSGLPFHLETFHCFVSVESIFDASSQYVVNARMSVGWWWAFIEHKLWASFFLVDCLMENVILLPLGQHVFVGLSKIKSFVLGKFISHILYLI